MPARRKGPHLWLRKERTDRGGTKRHAVWIIRDGEHRQSTGCARHDIAGAERALKHYIAAKHAQAVAQGGVRHPAQIPVADVLNIYARDVAPKHARPQDTAVRLKALRNFFASDTLANINGDRCRRYAATRPPGSARRELEDLRAAINHHRREGLCAEIVEVWLPQRGLPRERWLTRGEVARMVWEAWRYREKQNAVGTDRRTRRHIARFILVALYSGSRRAAVCGAALEPTAGRGWVDLDRGVFYRRAVGVRETKKRTPAIPLPPRLLAHLRRWKRLGQTFAVEWNGEAIASPRKAFERVVTSAGLDPREVTPHILRHTAATWLMQAGTDLWEAAGYLGMTVEMLSERYGHHHPRHLQNARNAFARHREAVAEPVARRA